MRNKLFTGFSLSADVLLLPSAVQSLPPWMKTHARSMSIPLHLSQDGTQHITALDALPWARGPPHSLTRQFVYPAVAGMILVVFLQKRSTYPGGSWGACIASLLSHM